MAAPKGNKNALKHGLYARHYPEEVKKSFLHWELDDYAAEIQLHRVALDRITVLLLGKDADADRIVKMNNAISNAVSSLVRASRQHVLFNSADNPVLVAWFDTLKAHKFFTGGEPEA